MNAEVIATFGRHLLLRDDAGTARMARPQGRQLEIVCGDRVRCESLGSETVVVAVLPRDTVLRRTSLRARSEPLAANLTQLAVVVAPQPAPDLFVVDRFICAAECAGLAVLIVCNKSELAEHAVLREQLQPYAALGYRLCAASAERAAHDPASLAPLRAALAGHTTVFAGQSGVGKSSLTRQLTDDPADIAIGALIREEEGRHTTTASRLYACDGGRIIDSPGVRDFAPAIDDLEPSTLGFREVAQLAPRCRFLDCRHLQEPHCAVREAMETGTVDARRYESYRRLRRLYDQLWEKRPAAERAARRR
ncbi:MAG TPA: ribosome small subunit-dependent GTPase A [Steroidobacteraceae bacterium]|nr:ribosome small subunit-dependent GTPase A [Steroidobacteraceae bacterium]